MYPQTKSYGFGFYSEAVTGRNFVTANFAPRSGLQQIFRHLAQFTGLSIRVLDRIGHLGNRIRNLAQYDVDMFGLVIGLLTVCLNDLISASIAPCHYLPQNI